MLGFLRAALHYHHGKTSSRLSHPHRGTEVLKDENSHCPSSYELSPEVYTLRYIRPLIPAIIGKDIIHKLHVQQIFNHSSKT